MAKRPARAPVRTAEKPKVGSFKTWAILGGLAVTLMVFYHTTVVLAVGLLPPSGMAYLFDRRPERYTAKTVFFLNLVGCLPVFFEVWDAREGLGEALDVALDPINMLLMYGSALAGWMIYFLVPPFVQAWLSVAHELRENTVRNRQKELVEEWGATVRREALARVGLEDKDADATDAESAEDGGAPDDDDDETATAAEATR